MLGFCIFLHLRFIYSSHCHIDWHVLLGMIAQFVEAPDVMKNTLKVPQVIYDQCRTNKCKKFRHWNLDQNYGPEIDEDFKIQEYAHGSVEGGKANGNGAALKFHFSLWEKFVNWFLVLFHL